MLQVYFFRATNFIIFLLENYDGALPPWHLGAVWMLFRLFVRMCHCDGMAVQTSGNRTDSPCLTSTFIITHMSQAAPDIYRDCLLPLRHGYPLYRPEPD